MGKALPRVAVPLGAALVTVLGASGATAAAPALMATTLVVKSGTVITVTAAVGRANTISAWHSGSTIHIDDTGDDLAAYGGCTLVSPGEVSCPAAGLTEFVVYAGDQNDEVHSYLATPGVTLIGGAGDDALFGGSANDTLEGDDGGDFLSGGNGNDTLSGGTGANGLSGGAGNDSIDGGPQNDVADGGAGNDVINGASGNDQLYAGAGNDYVGGDAGNDALYAQDGVFGNDYADGGSGTDTCSADPGDYVAGCP
ncbi:calcium-binding protein [Actinoplanes sp. NPDC049548]|uniref:calcium-binding protein n=1 Tax=Actinoplanes sp. NPDC049548 TaxID=3155152 RepID=UPI00343B9CAF